jgi:hypothetical protein
VLPQVLRSGLFWCNMLLHFAFQLLARTLPERTASSSSSTAPVVSSVGDTEATVDDSSLNRRLLGAGARLWSGMELMDPAPQTLPEVDWCDALRASNAPHECTIVTEERLPQARCLCHAFSARLLSRASAHSSHHHAELIPTRTPPPYRRRDDASPPTSPPQPHRSGGGWRALLRWRAVCTGLLPDPC